jgi:hypothetical protein
MRALEYSRFRYYHLDPSDIEDLKSESAPMLGGGPSRCIGVGIVQPPCIDTPNPKFPMDDAASVRRATAAERTVR